jgi:hypothetical protein
VLDSSEVSFIAARSGWLGTRCELLPEVGIDSTARSADQVMVENTRNLQRQHPARIVAFQRRSHVSFVNWTRHALGQYSSVVALWRSGTHLR